MEHSHDDREDVAGGHGENNVNQERRAVLSNELAYESQQGQASQKKSESGSGHHPANEERDNTYFEFAQCEPPYVRGTTALR